MNVHLGWTSKPKITQYQLLNRQHREYNNHFACSVALSSIAVSHQQTKFASSLLILILLNILYCFYKTMETSQRYQKWKTYVLTFSSYMTLHCMRMTYSHILPNFKQTFHQTNLFLGLFGACIYLALGLGFLLRFTIEDKKNIVKSFFFCITLACLGYLIIPLSSILLNTKITANYLFQTILPGLGLLLFGFWQFAAWPTLLTLINYYFNVRSEGTYLGFWSANGDFGNILGFTLSGLLVDTFSVRWEVAMIVAAFFCWIMALVVYLFIEERPIEQDNELAQQNTQLTNIQNEGQTQHREFLAFIASSFQSTQILLYLLAMGLLKSILVGFLLWMPTYLTHNHMAAQKSIIPIFFDVGTLFGSWILGSAYQHKRTQNHQAIQQATDHHIKSYTLFYASLGVVASLTVFYFIKASIAVYFVCSIVSGAFLGGCFNMLAGNEVFAIARGCRRKLSYLSTLSMVCGNFCVGVVQIIIGVVLDMKNDPQGEHKLFVILMVVGTVVSVVLFCRSRLLEIRVYSEIEKTEFRAIKE